MQRGGGAAEWRSRQLSDGQRIAVPRTVVQPDMRSGLCDGGWVAAAIVLRWEHDAIGGVRARRLYWHSRASEWQLRQQLLERQLGARLVVHGVVRQRIQRRWFVKLQCW